MIQNSSITFGTTVCASLPPMQGADVYQTGARMEQAVESLRQRGTGGRPPRNSRGTQVLLCTLGGIVVGVGAGFGIGVATLGATGWLTGSIIGFVIGGIAGSFVGEYLTKRKHRKLAEMAKKIDSGHGQGPILS